MDRSTEHEIQGEKHADVLPEEPLMCYEEADFKHQINIKEEST